jgi:hypothetical protein
MSKDLVISTLLDSIPKEVDESTRALAGRGGSKRISLKGGVFRKYVGGKEVGRIDSRSLEVVFVRVAPTPSRMYYNSTYQEGQKIAPLCWSTDSNTPDLAVKTPQAKSCRECPFSAKGSGPANTTACRIHWRTAVVMPNDPTGDVMQFVVPGKSAFGKEENGYWPLQEYGRMLGARSISITRVVTEMKFDTNANAPRVMFRPVAVVPETDRAVILSQGDSSDAISAVTLNVYQTDEGVDVAPVEPAVEVSAPVVEAPVEFEEPKVRQTSEPTPAASADVASVIKKWSKK